MFNNNIKSFKYVCKIWKAMKSTKKEITSLYKQKFKIYFVDVVAKTRSIKNYAEISEQNEVWEIKCRKWFGHILRKERATL